MLETTCVFHKFSRKMRWVVHWLLMLLPTALSYVDSGRQLPPVHWNSSNTMFHSSNNNHMIEVNLGDRLNIVCPHYTDSTVPMNQWEYYLIYMVDKHNYEVCVINDTSNKIVILNCSNPEYQKFFTLLIFEFQPIPGIPDFQMYKDYYFISTSGGRKFNINNQYEGVCKQHQMKMMLRVRPKSTDMLDNGPFVNANENIYSATLPSKPSTRTTSTTTTTSSTSTTAHHKSIIWRPSVNSPTDVSSDEEAVPGLDGFPDDEAVVLVGEGPNINSGIIADNGMDNSGSSLYNLHRHSVQLLCVLLLLELLLAVVLR